MTWNDYFTALAFVRDKEMLPVTHLPNYFLRNTMGEGNMPDYGPFFACLVLISLPVMLLYLFLQKRSLLKDSSPGLWDSSASGHLDVGEDYHDAAVRELAEELGIRQEVKMICSIKPSEKTGWEFVHLFKCEHGGPFNFPYSEIDCGEFFTTDMIENWISERPEDFASGFIECWENYQ